MRYSFACADCGAKVVYRDRVKAYVHLGALCPRTNTTIVRNVVSKGA
jgi:transcription initiation factor IIE alpha subunit